MNLWMQFKINVDSRRYVSVCVARTEKDMLKLGKEVKNKMRLKRREPFNNFIARAHLYDDGSEVAMVLFCRKWIGAGLIAHEMTHVALHLLARGNIQFRRLSEKSVEEKLCTYVDNLTKGFWVQFYKKR